MPYDILYKTRREFQEKGTTSGRRTHVNKVKDAKEYFPVQIAEYAVLNQISDGPESSWRIKKLLNKIDRIISNTARKYWQKTHKYGLRIPHTVKEAIEIDKENGDTLWWYSILKEMKNVRPVFEAYKGNKEDLPPGYQ